jgi:hypothetical protein
MKHTLHAISILLTIACAKGAEKNVVTLESIDGRTIEAEVISADREYITVRKNGSVSSTRIPVSSLKRTSFDRAMIEIKCTRNFDQFTNRTSWVLPETLIQKKPQITAHASMYSWPGSPAVISIIIVQYISPNMIGPQPLMALDEQPLALEQVPLADTDFDAGIAIAHYWFTISEARAVADGKRLSVRVHNESVDVPATVREPLRWFAGMAEAINKSIPPAAKREGGNLNEIAGSFRYELATKILKAKRRKK